MRPRRVAKALATRIRRIPSVPSTAPPELKAWAEGVKEWIEVRDGERGDLLDRAITARDLVDLDLAGTSAAFRGRLTGTIRDILGPPIDGGSPIPDLPTPPAIQGFSAVGLFSAIMLVWQQPSSQYQRHAYIEIWRSETPDFGQAIMIGTSMGGMYMDYVGRAAGFHYWARSVARPAAIGAEGVKGPFVGPVFAETAADIEQIIEDLSREINESDLAQELRSRIDLIDGLSSLPGSVNERLAIEAQARADALTDISDDLADEVQDRISALNQLADQVTAEANARVTAIQNLRTELEGKIDGIEDEIDSILADIADISGIPDFNENESYSVDDLVKWSGGLYRALQNMTAPSPLPSDENFWQKIGDYASLAEAVVANAGALSDLAVRVTLTEDGLVAEGDRIDSLQATITDPVTGLGSKASVNYVDGVIATEQGARATSLSNLETSLQGEITDAETGLQTQINARATFSDLTTLESNILGSSAENFTGISARFDTVETTATSNFNTLNTAISNVYGASVESFTLISAEFNRVDSDIASRATITQLNTAISDEESARVSAIQQLEADISDLTAGGVTSEALNTAINDAKADIFGASATSFTGLSATFSAIDSDIGTRATVTQLNEAVSDEQAARVLALNNLESSLQGEINNRATFIDLTNLETSILGSQVDNFTQIRAEFDRVDGDIGGNSAQISTLNTALANETSARAQQDSVLEARIRVASASLVNALNRLGNAQRWTISDSDVVFFTDFGGRSGVGARLESDGSVTVFTDYFEIDPTGIYEVRISLRTNQSFDRTYFGLHTQSGNLGDSNGHTTAVTRVTPEGARSSSSNPYWWSSSSGNGQTTWRDIRTYLAGSEANEDLVPESRGSPYRVMICDPGQTRVRLRVLARERAGQMATLFITGVSVRRVDEAVAEQGEETTAQIISTQQAVADVYQASVTDFTQINARFDSVDSDINNRATINQLNSAISDVYGASVETFSQIDAQFNNQQSQINNRATLTQLNSAVTDVYQSSVTSFTNIAARFASVDDDIESRATISQMQTAVANVYTSSVESFTQINARFSGVDNEINNRATVNQVNNAVASEADARAQQIDQVFAAIGDTNAAVETKAEASVVSDLEGNILDINAQYTIKVDANGHVAGIGLMSDGNTSQVGIVADRFYVTTPGGQNDYVPFIIDGGQVYMNAANIIDLTVVDAQIESLAADKIFAGQGFLNTAVIAKGEFDQAYFPGSLRSGNAIIENVNGQPTVTGFQSTYIPNSFGWIINTSTGFAEFRDIRARGSITATTGRIHDNVIVGTSGSQTLQQFRNFANQTGDRIDTWTRPGSTLIDGNQIFTGDAYVDTLQIRGQAVNFSVVATASNLVSTSGWTNVISATLPAVTAGARGDVIAIANFIVHWQHEDNIFLSARFRGSSDGDTFAQVSPLFQMSRLSNSTTDQARIPLTHIARIRAIDIDPSGDTISLQLQSGAAEVGFRSLILMEAKR